MTIQLDSKFDKAEDSLLIVAVSGSRREIAAQVWGIYQDLANGCKPGQGIAIGAEYTTQIITPVWNGKKC